MSMINKTLSRAWVGILGMIEPWPECQPEESRLREAQPEDSSIYLWLTRGLGQEFLNKNVSRNANLAACFLI